MPADQSGRRTVRSATEADAASIQAIYAPIVAETAISFEYEPPRVEEMARRIAANQVSWLVADAAGEVAGYAYAAPHSERAAYTWSVDTSVYVDARWRGTGVGRSLYEALFRELVRAGYVNAYAGITLPNEASVALHERCGFRPIGVYPTVGYKLGCWHDVGWWHRPLYEGNPPAEPKALSR